MDKCNTVGVDLAKNVFQAVICDASGKMLEKVKLRRKKVLEWFGNLEPCIVAMEGCAGAHYWGRKFEAQGHRVKIIPAQYVKPYVRGNKNDANDALAIVEASRCPQMRLVTLRTSEQQDIQAVHRMRQRLVREHTALCNQLRGLLGEHGLVAPTGVAALRKHMVQWLSQDGVLSEGFRRNLSRSYKHLKELEQDIAFYMKEIVRHGQNDDACRRLQTIPGFGPMTAGAFYAAVGDGSGYRRSRDVSASFGLVPRQRSSGGKEVMLRLGKRGGCYVRGLLVHGARSVVVRAASKKDRLSRWVERHRQAKGDNKAAVALANKMARIGWAVLVKRSVYQAL